MLRGGRQGRGQGHRELRRRIPAHVAGSKAQDDCEPSWEVALTFLLF